MLLVTKVKQKYKNKDLACGLCSAQFLDHTDAIGKKISHYCKNNNSSMIIVNFEDNLILNTVNIPRIYTGKEFYFIITYPNFIGKD